ncbi:MFS transporter [Streptomyces fructofermentans]|uniref:MFS transporter n=1 Tax=Streptomyces fructofermentans TaxID=152141 RepID=UPI003408F8EE
MAVAPRRFAPGFWRLWSATTISGLGDGIRIIALSVAAATVTGDPFLVSLVTVAGQLPWLVVGPFSGTLIDHLDRWRMLWICDVARAVVLTGLVTAILADRVGIGVLALTAFLLSSVETMADNLSQAVVPDMAGTHSLDSANSKLLSGRLVTMEFLGAPVGTALFVVAPLLPFGVATVCFAVSAVLVLGLRPPGVAPDVKGEPLTARVLAAQTAEGITWLWRHRLLRVVCLMVALLNFAVLAVLSIAVLYALHTLHVSETVYGLLLLVIASGGLIGLVVAPKVIETVGRGRSLQLAFAISPLSFVVAGVASHALVAAFALVFVGAAITLVNVITTTLRQSLIPQERFGRVNGAYRLVINGLTPIGGLVGGLVAGHFGLRAPFFVAAALLLAGTLLSLPLLSNRSLGGTPDHDGESGPADDGAAALRTETADQ